jgi:hypothetical protein
VDDDAGGKMKMAPAKDLVTAEVNAVEAVEAVKAVMIDDQSQMRQARYCTASLFLFLLFLFQAT